MRTRFVVSAAALLLSSQVGWAQTPPTKPAPADVPSTGIVDVGGRVGSTDGDEARFERYQDLRPGASTFFQLNKSTDKYVFGAEASNVGYRDQRYNASYYTGKVKVSGFFDSIPLNYLYDAPYIFTNAGDGVYTLPLSIRQAVQGPTNATNDGTVVGVPCAPGLGPVGCNVGNAGQALANRSAYNGIISANDMQVKRETVGGRFAVDLTQAVAFDVDFNTYRRSGEMPWAAALAFNNATEIPVELDQRNNEFKVGTEYVNAKGMIRADYWGSFFNNDIQALRWDNPIRATDFNNGLLPPNGPYDASAYSNGNGPAFGQMALWPGNTLNAFGFTGMYKLARTTTINGNLQYTYMRQNEALLPWTTNTSIANDAVFGLFPGLRALPRTSAQAAINAMNALVTFNTRPTSYLTLQARYRYNVHDNTTPSFDGRQNVRFDGVPEDIEDDPITPHVEATSEYFDIHRKNFDANATLSARQAGNFRFGYSHEGYEREGRGFTETGENIVKFSYDAMLSQYASVRANYDIGRRRGDGFILAGLDYETGVGGAQPGLRYYDEADRDRTRANVIFTVTPMDVLSVFAQYTTTRDEFLGDEFIPVGREQFGLLNQDVNAIAAGIDISPNDMLHFGVSFGQDKYESTQKSRNANPPPDAQWTDPARNWFLDNEETVRNANLYVDLIGLMQAKADLRIGYELNDSDNDYRHYGPRIDSLAAANTFAALPTIVNQWNRFTVDFKYFLTKQVGIGVGYLYDDLEISDWNTIDAFGAVGFTPATGTPRIDYLGALITGYGNRPYSGNRGFVRLLYRF